MIYPCIVIRLANATTVRTLPGTRILVDKKQRAMTFMGIGDSFKTIGFDRVYSLELGTIYHVPAKFVWPFD